MKTLKKVFKPWGAWNTINIEEYLEEMEVKGWSVRRLAMSQMLIEFERVEPRKVSYCVDYMNKIDDEYMLIHKDDGWEMINRSAGWTMWRKPYEGNTRPRIFTDNVSLLERNSRVIKILVFGLLAQIPAGLINLSNIVQNDLLIRLTNPMKLLLGTYIAAVAIIIYALTRMIIWNRKIKGSLGC